MVRRLDHTKGGQYEPDPARVQRGGSDFKVPFGWKRKLTPEQQARESATAKAKVKVEKKLKRLAHEAQVRAAARKKTERQVRAQRAANRQKQEAERKKKREAKAQERRERAARITPEEKRLRAEAKAAAAAALHAKYLAIARRRAAEIAKKKKNHLQAWIEEKGIHQSERATLKERWRSLYLRNKNG